MIPPSVGLTFILAALQSSVDMTATIGPDASIAVEERWDAPRPARVLDLSGVAAIEGLSRPRERRRTVDVDPDGTDRLAYRIVGSAESSRGRTLISWKLWCEADPVAPTSIRAVIAFANPPKPEDVDVQIMTQARHSRWAWDAGKLVIEFGDLAPGGYARIALNVPAATASAPFTIVGWLKGGGATILMLGLPAAAFLFMILYYVLRGRDPAVDGPAVPAAPLPPALMGVVLDEVADSREVVATWVDLARRGVVSFKPDGSFTARSDAAVLPFERRAIDALQRGPAELPGVVSAIYDEACVRGLFRANPGRERRIAYVAAALLGLAGAGFLVPALAVPNPVLVTLGTLLIPILLAGAAVRARTSGQMRFAVVAAAATALAAVALVWPAVTGSALTVFARLAVGLVASGAVVAAFAPILPSRTAAGAAWRLRAAEMERAIAAGPDGGQDDFETLLPYAVAFRAKKAWVHKAAAFPLRAPAWWKDAPLADVKDEFLAFLGGLSRRAAESAGSEGGA